MTKATFKFKKPKFTNTERAKLAVVFESLRKELQDDLDKTGSPYSNVDGCCGNCGDTGPHDMLLYRLELEVGLRKKS